LVSKAKNENSFKILKSSSMLNNKKTIVGSASGDDIKALSSSVKSAKILNIQTKDDSKSYKITEHHEEQNEEYQEEQEME